LKVSISSTKGVQVIEDCYPRADGQIGSTYRSPTRQLTCDLKISFQAFGGTFFLQTLCYVFDCVVVKVAFGISDAPFNLEENWGKLYVMGMENLMMEMIVRGDVKVMSLASFHLLVGGLST
jgi:hypothetical protein